MGPGAVDVLPFALAASRHGGTRAPALYLVTLSGPQGTVRGVAGAVRVDSPLPGAGLLPHEGVDAAAVAKRVRAWRRARVDREPVLLTHAGRGLAVGAAVRGASGLVETTVGDTLVGVARIGREAAEAVVADLGARQLLVADGHHRLAAAAEFASGRRERRDEDGGTPDAGSRARVTGLVVDADDTPLALRPIHRVLARRRPTSLAGADVAAALRAVQPLSASLGAGRALPVDGRARHAPAPPVSTSAPPEPGPPAEVVVVDREGTHTLWCPPDPVAGLPTTAHVVERALAVLGVEAVTRVREPDRALAMARGRGTVALLLPALDLAQVVEAVAAGSLMPVKATSFEPKPPAGVLVRTLTEG